MCYLILADGWRAGGWWYGWWQYKYRWLHFWKSVSMKMVVDPTILRNICNSWTYLHTSIKFTIIILPNILGGLKDSIHPYILYQDLFLNHLEKSGENKKIRERNRKLQTEVHQLKEQARLAADQADQRVSELERR